MELRMGKNSLSSEYVERAARLARELTRMRTRGPGDTQNAMRSLGRDYGIDYGIIWRLRYAAARLRDVPAGVLARLQAAYVAECERQARRLAHEAAIARKLSGADLDKAVGVVDEPQVSACISSIVGAADEKG
jgi:hypothetical protein